MQTIENAEQAISGIDAAAARLAEAIRHEALIREACDDELDAITNSLIGQPDPMKAALKDGTQPPHSATSARAAAEKDESYRRARKQLLEAEVERSLASAALEVAKQRAYLNTRLAAAELGV